MTAHEQTKNGAKAAEGVAPDIEVLGTIADCIADWKEDLQARISRAGLRFELLDAELDFSDLQEEVADFVRACRAVMWRPPAC
jgi:hypothetical protein